MKKHLLIGFMLLAAGGLSEPLAAQSLDPSFVASSIYSPGTVFSAVEQADGKRVVVGSFSRVNGTASSTLARFNPNGTVDASFQQNLGTTSSVFRVGLLGNGQLLLTSFYNGSLAAGGITRNCLLRLNADGTGDAAFDTGTGPSMGAQAGAVDYALPLPNGQLLAVGYFDHFNGSTANGIVRLNASGTVDASLNAGAGANDEILTAVALPNGQFLVGGYFSTYNGVTRHGLARLNADGSLDPTFNTGFVQYDEVTNLAVQPDGRILVGGSVTMTGGNQTNLSRLLTDGSFDSSFILAAALQSNGIYSIYGNAFELQPDGKILFISEPSNTIAGAGVGRLNANGSLDTSFQPGTGPSSQPFSLTRLANGGVLVMGSFNDFGDTPDRSLIQLSSNGGLDPTFQPLIQAAGLVSKIVRQTDGKLLVGGSFSEINGRTIRRLARFNTDGTFDNTFILNIGSFTSLMGLIQQPDSRILVATATSLRRYLSNGSIDNSFTAFTTPVSTITQLLLQPDGRIIVNSNNSFNIRGSLLRLMSDGSPDASFAPTPSSGRLNYVQALALQPNGKILLAGNVVPVSGASYRTVLRLESTGAQDASFSNLPINTFNINAGIYDLMQQPDGKLLVGGQFTTVGGVARAGVARLNADGTLDTGFAPPQVSGAVYKLLLQPNNRILMGGSFSGSGLPNNLARLLPTGAVDATYGATAVPNGAVRALSAQPDGSLVIGGGFTKVNGLTYQALARLTASNVLHVAAPQAVAERTQAWPVPAHATLTVAPDASAHPKTAELLDLLGRPVLRQTLNGIAPAVMPLETVRAGTYLLRVSYTEGDVLRRIQVQ